MSESLSIQSPCSIKTVERFELARQDFNNQTEVIVALVGDNSRRTINDLQPFNDAMTKVVM